MVCGVFISRNTPELLTNLNEREIFRWTSEILLYLNKANWSERTDSLWRWGTPQKSEKTGVSPTGSLVWPHQTLKSGGRTFWPKGSDSHDYKRFSRLEFLIAEPREWVRQVDRFDRILLKGSGRIYETNAEGWSSWIGQAFSENNYREWFQWQIKCRSTIKSEDTEKWSDGKLSFCCEFYKFWMIWSVSDGMIN